MNSNIQNAIFDFLYEEGPKTSREILDHFDTNIPEITIDSKTLISTMHYMKRNNLVTRFYSEFHEKNFFDIIEQNYRPRSERVYN